MKPLLLRSEKYVEFTEEWVVYTKKHVLVKKYLQMC